MHKEWLKILDEWRNKFTVPLTRKQACEVLLDDSKYKEGEFMQPKMKDLFWADCEKFMQEIIYEK